MHCCRQGHTSIVLMLINHKADVSQRDENDCTALMWACALGDIDIAHELASHGASTILCEASPLRRY